MRLLSASAPSRELTWKTLSLEGPRRKLQRLARTCDKHLPRADKLVTPDDNRRDAPFYSWPRLHLSCHSRVHRILRAQSAITATTQYRFVTERLT